MTVTRRSNEGIAVSLIVLLSLGSAACYVLATIIMKRWGAIGNVEAVVLVTVALAAAVFLETEALRQARLGHVLIVILGFETCLALLCAWFLLREAYAPHEVLGLALIILGVAVAHLTPATGAA